MYNLYVQEVSYKINDVPLTIIICNVLNGGFITLCFPHIYLNLCIATCTTFLPHKLKFHVFRYK